jgi:hypothetical protein
MIFIRVFILIVPQEGDAFCHQDMVTLRQSAISSLVSFSSVDEMMVLFTHEF